MDSGGLGLTGGLVDVGNLADCLTGMHKGLASDSLLDRYNEVRRQKYNDVINPGSSSNMARLWHDPEEVVKEEPFFQALRSPDLDMAKFSNEGRKVSDIPRTHAMYELLC